MAMPLSARMFSSAGMTAARLSGWLVRTVIVPPTAGSMI
jgi:hypothetical protein